MQFVISSLCHLSLQTVTLDEVKVKDQTVTSDISISSRESTVKRLSLCNASLTTEFFTILESSFKGRLLSLSDMNLTDNPTLTPQCIQSLVAMTTNADGHSSLTRLTYGLNDAEILPDLLLSQNALSLNYLNLRKAKMSATAVGKLSPLVSSPDKPLATLVLDGLKLAGTGALKDLLGKCYSSQGHLVALSLGGCLLSDDDLSPLTSAIKAGLQLQMLKLAANRITDKCVSDLVSALLVHKEHSLAVLDLSNNQVGSVGAESLVTLYTCQGHTSQLHSLNLSHNNIGKEGLSRLMSAVGDKLRTVYVNNQTQGLEEADITQVFLQLLHSLGVAVERDEEGHIKTGSCNLPRIPEGFFVNLSNLGGHVGDVGQAIDCGSVVTDYRQKHLPYLTLEQICQLAAYLRSSGSDECVLSQEEWDLITGCKKDREIPSWLNVSECRDRAVFMTHLPGTTTSRRLEGLFETEADCNIEEIYLTKDAVSRKFNGVSWGLMSDIESLQRLVKYFLQGEAQIFGQSFTVSRLKVKVDDAACSEAEAQARRDLERRSRERQVDDAAHRNLIQQSADESWKRHAYRLAHPAYADGRVW